MTVHAGWHSKCTQGQQHNLGPLNIKHVTFTVEEQGHCVVDNKWRWLLVAWQLRRRVCVAKHVATLVTRQLKTQRKSHTLCFRRCCAQCRLQLTLWTFHQLQQRVELEDTSEASKLRTNQMQKKNLRTISKL